jgi:hypothetical protein
LYTLVPLTLLAAMSLAPVSDVSLTSAIFILLLEAAPGRPEPVRRP